MAEPARKPHLDIEKETRPFIEALVPKGQTLTFQTFADAKETTFNVARSLHGPLDEDLPELRKLNKAVPGPIVGYWPFRPGWLGPGA